VRYFSKRIFSSVLVVGIALLFAATVQGAYIGPDRSYSYSCNRRKVCTYEANHPDETYNCTLTLYTGPDDNCQSAASIWPYFSVAGGCTHWTHNCSTAGECSVWSTGSSTQSCTIGQTGCVATTCSGTYSSATCSSSVTCASYGDNGWCSGSGSVTFNASEPISGEVITYIEGSYGSGDQTLCDPANAANVSCSWTPSTDGNFGLSYWAHSSWGDTSTMGSASLKIDTVSPTASFNLAGTHGTNGWWVSPVTVTVTGSDATSGIASTNLTVNSSPAASPATVSAEGVNAVTGSVVDNAGWSSNTVSQTINIDTVSPTVSLTLSPATPNGSSGWYIASPQATVSGSDATSGLASTGVRLDGGASQASPVFVSDGSHSVVGEARDVAGNTANTSSLNVNVDTAAPSIAFVNSPSAPDGDNNWYISWPTVAINGADAASGLADLLIKMDGGAWESGPISVSSDGVHVFAGTANDVAGNSNTLSQTLNVDTVDPSVWLAVSPSTPDGDNNWYVSMPTLNVAASDSVSGIADTLIKADGGAWESGPVTVTTDGTHVFEGTANDVAGNLANTPSRTIQVDTIAPVVELVVSPATPDGDNNWYISWPTVNINGSDGGSGLEDVLMKVDGGAWESGPITVSSDGTHVFDGMAKDVAGWTENISETLRIDTTAPVLSFTSHSDGYYIAGSVTIKGDGLDAASGLAIVEFSSDGTTWQSASLSGGAWSYYWDASALNDGNYTLSVRGYDAAGNYGETSIDIVLIRSLPSINISELWYIWQSGDLNVTEGGVPITSVRVTVSDPQGRWPSVVIYSSSRPDSKSQVTWDRLFGDGTVAPPGTYNVVATVTDTMGRKASDTGQIVIPESSTATPTAKPTKQDQPTAEPTTPASTPEPTVVAEVPPDEPPEEKEPIVVIEKDLKPFPWLLSLGFVAVALIGVTRLYDPRPPALRKIADLFDDASAINQEINTTKNINTRHKK